MTNQETFDIVARALIKQGRPAFDNLRTGGACRYRFALEDGTILKCAAGHLIPDEKYDPRMEGVGVYLEEDYECCDEEGKSKVRLLNKIIGEEGHDLSLVRELQTAHDDAAMFSNGGIGILGFMEPENRFIKIFRDKMRLIAQDFSLSADVLSEEIA